MNLPAELNEKWGKKQAEKDVRVVRHLEKWSRGEEGVTLISPRAHTLVFEMEGERRPGFASAIESEIKNVEGEE